MNFAANLRCERNNMHDRPATRAGARFGESLRTHVRWESGRGADEGGDIAQRWIQLYGDMLRARIVDNAKDHLVSRGEAFFHIPGNGHEGAAVLNHHLTPDDWLHLHYRDKALMIARGVPCEAFIHSILSSDRSPSLGRQMSGMLSYPKLRLLSTPTLVGNSALQAVGVAKEIEATHPRALVVCSMGDGATQQGEVLEAISEAVRSQAPILFLIEDNGLSISTRTEGKTFFSLPDSDDTAPAYLGMPIHRIDGRHVVAADCPLGAIVQGIREKRRPAIVVLRVERLANHTNADDQRVYRDSDELRRAVDDGDPIQNLRRHLIKGGLDPNVLARLDAEIRREVQDATDRALLAGQPLAETASKRPLVPSEAQRREYIGTDAGPRLTMLEAIRRVLRCKLTADARVSLYGQDIEDPKGDVFGVTKGLST